MTRPVDLARLGAGLVALSAPGSFARGPADTGRARAVVRVLGARYVGQSALGLLGAKPWVPQVDAAIDLLHAGSMVGLAAFSSRYRRLALVSTAAAVAFAAADLTEARR